MNIPYSVLNIFLKFLFANTKNLSGFKLKGPRSCPGGGGQHFFDFDSLDDDISGVNGGTLDRSLEARSEFISTQPHRRSSRRRALQLDGKTSTSQSASHPPFSEIGNGRSRKILKINN